MNSISTAKPTCTSGLIRLLLLPIGIVLISLWGCSFDNGVANLEYQLQFNKATDQIANNNYDEAEKSFTALIDMLEKEPSQSDAVIELRADIDYALGKIAINRGDYYAAYDNYNSAYIYYKSLFQENGEKTLDARIRLAEIESSYLSRSEHALSEFINIYDETNISKYKNVALCNATSLYINMDNGTEADRCIALIEGYLRALPSDTDNLRSFVREHNDKATDAQNVSLGRIANADQFLYAYRVLGEYYVKCDNPDRAIEMYEAALSLFDAAEIDNEDMKIEFYSDLGFMYSYYKGEYDGNMYLTKAIEHIEKSYPNGIRKASAYILVAEKHLAAGNYDQFGKYLNDAIAMAENTAGHNHKIVALAQILLSHYNRIIGEYRQAIANCEDAIEIMKNVLKEDDDSLGSHYNNLANCYVMSGDKEKAVDTYLKSIEIYKRFGNDIQVAVASRNLALIYNNSLHNHALALQYAREAISIVDGADKSYYNSTIAAIYMVMADILTPSDYDYAKVEEYAEKAYSCLQNAVGNVNEHIGNYHYNLGKYLSDNYRYSEALTHLLSAEDVFGEVYIEVKLYPVDIFGDIAYCYYNINLYDEALNYFEKSVGYNKEHISLLHEQGNYRTSYWENCQQQSMHYIEYIESMRKDG